MEQERDLITQSPGPAENEGDLNVNEREVVDSLRDSALHRAVLKEQDGDEEPDIDIEDGADLNPLDYAIMHCEVKTADLLLDNKANANKVDGMEASALPHNAGKEEKTDFLLLERGANSHAANFFGKRPLHDIASSDGTNSTNNDKLKIIDSLIKEGANINAQDGDLCTPLHVALHYRKNQALVQKFLDVGASIVIPNFDNKTCYDLSKEKCRPKRSGPFGLKTYTDPSACKNKAILMWHALKLKEAQLPINIHITDREMSFQGFDYMKPKLDEELKRIKEFIVCDNFSLGTVFSAFKNPLYLKDQNIITKLEAFLDSKEVVEQFPEYGCILRNVYKASKEGKFELYEAAGYSGLSWGLKLLGV